MPQLPNDIGGGRTPAGSARHTPHAAAALSTATSAKAQRQPRVSATKLCAGMPSTEASDQPRKMKVIARPRCSGGASTLIAAAACGVNTAAASMLSTRTGSSAAKLGIRADTAWPTAYQSSASVSSRRRSQWPIAAASVGAPTPMATAAAVMSWPPTAGRPAASARGRSANRR